MDAVEIVRCRDANNAWQVERFDSDGGVEITAFYGNNPKDRATSYAKLLAF